MRAREQIPLFDIALDRSRGSIFYHRHGRTKKLVRSANLIDLLSIISAGSGTDSIIGLETAAMLTTPP